MSSLQLHQVVRVAREIEREAPHRIGIAVYVDGQAMPNDQPGEVSWAMAVAQASDGSVLAWDGWYFDGVAEEHRTPLESLPFDDFDDMRSKLLLDPNRAWLGGPLADFLMPTYSLAQLAGRIVAMHADSGDDADARRGFGRGDLVAYFPVTETAAVLTTVEKFVAAADKHSFGNESATRALRIVLDAVNDN